MTRRVSVESCKNGPERIDLLVVAFDKQLVEGKEQEITLGEKALSFPGGTKPADMLDTIREAGEQIEEAAANAKEIREELNRELQEEANNEMEAD